MPKVLIDIPDKAYRRISEKSEVLYSEMIILNGTPLTDLTNGEVIQKMFPDAKISFEEEWDSYDDGDFCNSYVERFVNVEFEHAQTLTFSLEWWNRKWGG